MQTIEIQKGVAVGVEDLAQRISELDDFTLRLFFEQLNQKFGGHQQVGTSLAAFRKPSPNRPVDEEARLLKQLKTVLPASVVKRYRTLRTKAQGETIVEKERQEMLLLNDFIEARNVERLKLLWALARIRQVTLPEIVQQFPIKKYF
jgi:hypothetical protein